MPTRSRWHRPIGSAAPASEPLAVGSNHRASCGARYVPLVLVDRARPPVLHQSGRVQILGAFPWSRWTSPGTSSPPMRRVGRTSPSPVTSVERTSPPPRSTFGPSSPWLLATSPSRLDGAHRRKRDVGEFRRESGRQAFASASRDAARRRHGDVRLRRRLDELGYIAGFRFSLGLRPPVGPRRAGPGSRRPWEQGPALAPMPLTTDPEPVSGRVMACVHAQARRRPLATAGSTWTRRLGCTAEGSG